MLKDYECAVIVAPGLSPEALKDSTKRYAEVITSKGGTLTKIDEWGKRSLAYEIKKHREGYYYFYKFQGDNSVLRELNRQLRLDENVLRHMIVKDDYRKRQPVQPKTEPTKPEDETEKEGM